MSANVEAMIRAGIDAFRAGNKADARTLLERAIELEEYNEMAWLWLSAVVETPEEQRTCLENVLVINPNSDRAKQGLKSLGIDPEALRPAENAASADGNSFNFDSADDLFGDADFGASPVSTGTGGFDPIVDSTSMAPVDLHSTDDYDNWVGGLNLGKKAETEEEAINQTNPFGAFNLDNPDAIFGDDSAFDTNAQVALNEESADFDDSQNPFGDLRFGDSDIEDGNFPTGATSPFRDLSFESAITQQGNEAEFDELFDENAGGQAQPDEVFLQIPSEIASANRLPGMDESMPRTAFVFTGLLVILNGAALGFMLLQLLT
jgi:hypothetical protein